MKIVDRFLEINNNNKWKRKYNRLCIQYEVLANETIQKLEKENNYLKRIIDYRDDIDKLKEEIMQYRRKYGRLKGGDKDDKDKNKRKA